VPENVKEKTFEQYIEDISEDVISEIVTLSEGSSGMEAFDKHFSGREIDTKIRSNKGVAIVLDAEGNKIDKIDPSTVVQADGTVDVMQHKGGVYIFVRYDDKEGYVNVNKVLKPLSSSSEIENFNASSILDDVDSIEYMEIEWLDYNFEAYYIGEKDVDKSIAGIMDNIRNNPEIKANVNLDFLDSLEENLLKPSKRTFDWGDVDNKFKNIFGKYLGEIFLGLLAIKGYHDDSYYFSGADFIPPKTNVIGFLAPVSSNFNTIDTFVELEDNTLVAISNKASKGASASVFTGILKKIIDDEIEIPEELGVISRMVEMGKKHGGFTGKSPNIIYAVVLEKILGMSIDGFEFFEDIKNMRREDILKNPDYRKIIAEIERRHQKGTLRFDYNRLKGNLHNALTGMFTRELAAFMNQNEDYLDFGLSVLGAKDFFQANLDMTKFKKGHIHYKISHSGSMSLTFEGGKAPTTQLKPRQGSINYTLR
jgi:hypothetical protein